MNMRNNTQRPHQQTAETDSHRSSPAHIHTHINHIRMYTFVQEFVTHQSEKSLINAKVNSMYTIFFSFSLCILYYSSVRNPIAMLPKFWPINEILTATQMIPNSTVILEMLMTESPFHSAVFFFNSKN